MSLIDSIFNVHEDHLGISESEMDLVLERCTEEELEEIVGKTDKAKAIIEKYLEKK